MADASIRLREIEHSDLPSIHRWRCDRDVQGTTTGCFRHVSGEVDEAWFERHLKSRDHNVRLAVELEPEGELVGVVYLLGIDWIARTATLGLMIGEKEHWHKGVGSEAVRLAVRHAFDDLNLHRLELQVLEGHDRAIRAYEKAGFVREGLLRDATYKGGRYHSLVAMGLVNDAEGGSA